MMSLARRSRAWTLGAVVGAFAVTIGCEHPPSPVAVVLDSVEGTPVTLRDETRPALPPSPGGRWDVETALRRGHLVLAGGVRGDHEPRARRRAVATFLDRDGGSHELIRGSLDLGADAWTEWVVPVPSELEGREGTLRLEIEGEDPVSSVPVAVPADGSKARPNVILISIDTLRSDRLGCYGNDRATSPAIDRLARRGVRCERAVAPSNWTLPSHYSMMTSLYPTAHGVNPDRAGFGGFRRPTHVPAIRGSGAESTLAERLSRLGYLAAAITEDGWVHPGFGFDQGFASFVADTAGTLESTGRRVLSWLDEHRDLPFFLFVHTYQPHQPYDPPPPYDAMFVEPGHVGYALPGVTVPMERLEDFQAGFFTPTPEDVEAFRGLYDGEVRYVDTFISDLVAALEDDGLAGRTIVVFTSDHGEEIFEHGRFTHGDALYDEVMRVPLILWGPGLLPEGIVIREPVSLLDILPTVLELTGGEVEAPVQGRSLLPALRGADDGGPRDLFAEGVGKDSSPLYCVWRGSEKYILGLGGAGVAEELYDLRADPGETNNRAGVDPTTAADLRAAVESWIVENEKLGAAFAGADAEMDPQVLERLRALGYVD